MAGEEVAESEDSTSTETTDPIYEQKIQKIAAQIKSNKLFIDMDNQSAISESEDALQNVRTGSLVRSPTSVVSSKGISSYT